KNYPGYVPYTCGVNGRTNWLLKSRNINQLRVGALLHWLARKATCSRLLLMRLCQFSKGRMERPRKSFRGCRCSTNCWKPQGDMSRKLSYRLAEPGFFNLMMGWFL